MVHSLLQQNIPSAWCCHHCALQFGWWLQCFHLFPPDKPFIITAKKTPSQALWWFYLTWKFYFYTWVSLSQRMIVASSGIWKMNLRMNHACVGPRSSSLYYAWFLLVFYLHILQLPDKSATSLLKLCNCSTIQPHNDPKPISVLARVVKTGWPSRNLVAHA